MQQRYDQDAERGIIGAAILYPGFEITVRGEDFYSPAHEQLWDLIKAQPKPITIEGATQAMIAHPIPGIDPSYLQTCLTAAPSKYAVEQVGNIVSGLAQLRQMAQLGARLIQSADTAEWDAAEETLDEGRRVLDQVMADSRSGFQLTTFHDALMAAVDEWESPAPKAFPTGWSDLDSSLNGGWRPGQVTVVGARPAVGKSVVASCAAVAAQAYGAIFFSLEMSRTEVVSRMSASAAAVNLSAMSKRQMNDLDWKRLQRLAGKSQNWPVYIEETSRITMAQIRSIVRTATRKGPVPLVVIDYAQLVTPADRTESRERQVSRILEDCKHLAKEFDTHVLALAQVNRGSTQREDKRPTMSDLRESGGIEAHADNIILLHRDDDEVGEIQFIVAKNRHGETGTIRLAWRPNFASVNSMANEPGDYRHGLEAS